MSLLRALIPRTSREFGLSSSSFHSTPRYYAQSIGGQKNKGNSPSSRPSRSRLVKDLKPKLKSGGKLEVAPKQPAFSRDPAPHVGIPEVTKKETPYRWPTDRWERRQNVVPESMSDRPGENDTDRWERRRDVVPESRSARRGENDTDRWERRRSVVPESRSARRGENDTDRWERRRNVVPESRSGRRGVNDTDRWERRRDVVPESRSARRGENDTDRWERRRDVVPESRSARRGENDTDRWERRRNVVPESRSGRRGVNDRMREIGEKSMRLEASTSKVQNPPASLRTHLEGRKSDKVDNPLEDEFDLSSSNSRSSENLPTKFTSPPLLEGLQASISDILGPDSKPTPIQALSLKHLFTATSSWRQYLLASETGSGKSIAYLLPMLQDLKQSELNSPPSSQLPTSTSRRAINPRALVLAPTHELSRQLSSFAKALLHNIKLRVLCTSQANTKSTPRTAFTAAKMSEQFQSSSGEGENSVHKNVSTRPVDVLVGTPSRLLELARGRRWDRKEDDQIGAILGDSSGGRIKTNRRSVEPEMGLKNIQWVIVDEADVLFDPDFQEHTRMLLADISAARGHPVEFKPELLPAEGSKVPAQTEYPFNLILTTATIPSSLAAYLDAHHPSLTRLASPNLHHLPPSLQTEYTSWTTGNKDADVERRIRRVWAEDSIKSGFNGQRSKILIFCNKNTKVQSLSKFLEGKGIPNVALTRTSENRKIGSNHHLDGFLKAGKGAVSSDDEPHVLITTSLLSRGLDFSRSIEHVFIVDEPRNMIDFLHRAGRSGRAGEAGKVVVFGKLKGRGSARTKDVRLKVGALKA